MEQSNGTEKKEIFERGYAWRARIGHVTPTAIDEVMSHQFHRMAPPGVTMVQTSLGVREVTEAGIADGLERAEEAAKALASVAPDCVIVGGSPTAVIGGFGSDVRLAENIERLIGIPTTTAQGAAIEAMRSLGMERLAVVSVLSEFFTDRLTGFLEDSGFVVGSVERLSSDSQSMDLGVLARMPLRTTYEAAVRAFRRVKEGDGVYVPTAPTPVVDVIEVLEEELGAPVVASPQAALWKGLEMAGVSVRVTGYGRLLRDRAGSR